MKPSWDEAPDFAQYLAMDDNGDWYWYEFKPVQRIATWGISAGRYLLALKSEGGWRNTMEARPCSPPPSP